MIFSNKIIALITKKNYLNSSLHKLKNLILKFAYKAIPFCFEIKVTIFIFLFRSLKKKLCSIFYLIDILILNDSNIQRHKLF